MRQCSRWWPRIRGPELLHLIGDRGLEARVRDIVAIGTGVHRGERKRKGFRGARARQAIDDHTTRVAELEELRDLVEGLAAGVVDCGSEHLDVFHPAHQRDEGVAPGDEKPEVGIVYLVLQVWGVEVGENVVHAHDRDAEPEGKRLREAQPHHEGPGEPRTRGYGDAVDVGGSRPGIFECPIVDVEDPLGMLPRGNFRHDTAVGGMKLDLRCNLLRDEAPPVLDESDRALIA